MGSVSRKHFIKQIEFKTKHETTTRWKPPQRQTFCRICGNPTTGKKLCQSCADFIAKKGVNSDKH